MTKQQRLVKQRSDNQKRLFLQSKFLRKTGERVSEKIEQPKQNPFRNESKIANIRKEAKERKDLEIAKNQADAAEKRKERETRGKKFKNAKNSNGQPRLGHKIQDILDKLLKENSQ